MSGTACGFATASRGSLERRGNAPVGSTGRCSLAAPACWPWPSRLTPALHRCRRIDHAIVGPSPSLSRRSTSGRAGAVRREGRTHVALRDRDRFRASRPTRPSTPDDVVLHEQRRVDHEDLLPVLPPRSPIPHPSDRCTDPIAAGSIRRIATSRPGRDNPAGDLERRREPTPPSSRRRPRAGWRKASRVHEEPGGVPRRHPELDDRVLPSRQEGVGWWLARPDRRSTRRLDSHRRPSSMTVFRPAGTSSIFHRRMPCHGRQTACRIYGVVARRSVTTAELSRDVTTSRRAVAGLSLMRR